MVSLGVKRAFYFGKAHSCTFKRERKVEKHRVTFTLLSFRASPSLYSQLNALPIDVIFLSIRLNGF